MIKIQVESTRKTEQFTHRVIEITVNPCSPQTRRDRLQVEHLPDHATFPEQAQIEPGANFFQGLIKLGQYTETGASLGGNILELEISIDTFRTSPAGAFGTGRGPFPEVFHIKQLTQFVLVTPDVE